jgi:ribosomal protein L34
MKTTVEISDPLMREARAAAVREGRTLRSLLEEGLREVLAGRRKKGRMLLPDTSVGGNGLQPGVDLQNAEQIRALTYEGRGG